MDRKGLSLEMRETLDRAIEREDFVLGEDVQCLSIFIPQKNRLTMYVIHIRKLLES